MAAKTQSAQFAAGQCTLSALAIEREPLNIRLVLLQGWLMCNHSKRCEQGRIAIGSHLTKHEKAAYKQWFTGK